MFCSFLSVRLKRWLNVCINIKNICLVEDFDAIILFGFFKQVNQIVVYMFKHLYIKHKYYKIVKRDQQQHLIAVHEHLTKEELVILFGYRLIVFYSVGWLNSLVDFCSAS
jgi:hypothetical protein